jgi:hypothetical protein
MWKLSNKTVDYVQIKTKSWEKYVMSWTIEGWNRLLNWANSFIRLWTWLVNKFEIVSIDKYELNDVDMYVAGISDGEIKKRLKEIIKERESKWLKINWVKHLTDIYNERFQSNLE